MVLRPMLLEPAVDPGEERVNMRLRLTLGQPMQARGLSSELAPSRISSSDPVWGDKAF